MIFSKNDIQKIRDALLDVDENSLTETSANILPVKLLLLDLHEMMSLIAEKINQDKGVKMDNQEKIKEILNEKGKALSDLLKENFNPYTAIVITSTEVKIVQVESCIPTADYLTRE